MRRWSDGTGNDPSGCRRWAGDLTGVHPAEVFPSELRGSGTGTLTETGTATP